MELKWKTRGDVPPQHKPRVYFCCHEADFDTYFESIALDILQQTDCAIWYRDTLPTVSDEEYVAQLQQMQLFVMPVTTRLLTTANAALDIDFPIAQTEHIPILPLIQEPGLEELFNAKCGTLMVLDKSAQDATALKYEDKLKRFLNAVLVGDEQAARIRAAFDAYIFLSYRKKDRKYAQDLMRLIHKNDFARDIAIWYDEFLTPGEDFNTNIGDALDKSVLYALTVTPNLLEQGNYIMEHEYPAACSTGKPILPVEMLHTDREALEHVYTNLPDSISDEAQLSAALANTLQTIALRQNDQDPEHNFFIGLAYLGGIDVERDTAKALELITSSAEKGLPEAMDKLRSIYENGDGVKRNYHTAIYWQEKLTEHYRKVWEESSDWQDGNDYAYELYFLSASYQELKMNQEASLTAHTLYDLAKDKSWGWDYRYYAAAILGDIAKEERQFQAAKEWFDLGLQEALNEGDNAYRGQIIMYNRLSLLSNLMADTASARAYGEAMLDIAKKRCETEDKRDHVIIALLNIAGAWRIERNYPHALDYVHQALELAETICREKDSISTQEHLAITLSTCATYHAEAKEFDKALEYAYRSLELQKKLAEDTGSISNNANLMEVYNSLCNLLLWKGNAEQAFPYCDILMEQSQALYQTAATAETQKQLSVVYHTKGKLCQATGRVDEARDCFLRSLELSPPEDTTYYDLFLTLSNHNALADLLEAKEDYAQALPHREQVVTLAQRSCDLSLSPVTLQELFISHNNLAACLTPLKQFDQMQQNYDTALEVAEAAGDYIKPDEWYTLASNYSNVLSIFIDACDENTLAVCLNYLKIFDHLTPDLKDAKLRNNLALVYGQLAKYHAGHNMDTEAISYHLQHISLRRQLLEETKLPQHREFLADALYDFALLKEGSGEDLPLFEEAATLYQRLQKEAPELYHLFRISYCCTMLGRQCKQQGKQKHAEDLFTEAVETAQQVARQTNKAGDRRRWAVALVDLINLHMDQQNFRAAHKHLLTAQALYDGLVEEFGRLDDRSNVAVVQTKLGELAMRSGDAKQALTLLTAASNTLKLCIEEDNNPDTRLSYTGCLERLAQFHQSHGDKQAARDCIDIIVPLREQSYEEAQTLINALNLALSYQNAFLARAYTGDALGAADACDKNIDLLSEWTNDHPQQAEPPLAVAYHSRSILCAEAEDEQWCLEQAAQLAVKYPHHPGCKNILEHLPNELKPQQIEEPVQQKRGLFEATKSFFKKYF